MINRDDFLRDVGFDIPKKASTKGLVGQIDRADAKKQIIIDKARRVGRTHLTSLIEDSITGLAKEGREYKLFTGVKGYKQIEKALRDGF